MNKDLTEMVFILDRSGSMWGVTTDTINEYRVSRKVSDEFAKRIEEDYETRGNKR